MQIFGLAMTSQTSKRKISPMAPQVDCSSCGFFCHMCPRLHKLRNCLGSEPSIDFPAPSKYKCWKKWSSVSRKVVELCSDDTEMVNMQAIKNDELI